MKCNVTLDPLMKRAENGQAITVSTCFLKTREFGDCGEFRGKAELVSLDNCTSDISSQLSRCHLGREAISEGDLILARLGLFCMPETQKRDMFICAKHRAHLGQYWSKPSACKYPGHKGGHKAAKTDRAFTLTIAQNVWKVFGVLVPVGARKYHYFAFNIGNCFWLYLLASEVGISKND